MQNEKNRLGEMEFAERGPLGAFLERCFYKNETGKQG